MINKIFESIALIVFGGGIVTIIFFTLYYLINGMLKLIKSELTNLFS